MRYATPDGEWLLELVVLEGTTPTPLIRMGSVPRPTHDGHWLAVSQAASDGVRLLRGYYDSVPALMAALPGLVPRWAELEPIADPPRPLGRNLAAAG